MSVSRGMKEHEGSRAEAWVLKSDTCKYWLKVSDSEMETLCSLFLSFRWQVYQGRKENRLEIKRVWMKKKNLLSAQTDILCSWFFAIFVPKGGTRSAWIRRPEGGKGGARAKRRESERPQEESRVGEITFIKSTLLSVAPSGFSRFWRVRCSWT